MIDIKLWSNGDDLIYQAIAIARKQGEVQYLYNKGLLGEWEAEEFVEEVNRILEKHDLEPIKNLEEGLEYKVLLKLRMKGQDMLEKYGRQVGAVVGDY